MFLMGCTLSKYLLNWGNLFPEKRRANGGKGLKGEGVTIGIGDDADIQYHIDFKGRLINNTSASLNAHGTHVSGIAAGGGLVDELLTGYAPKATIVSNSFNSIINNAPAYVQDYKMVLTNNSYGGTAGCDPPIRGCNLPPCAGSDSGWCRSYRRHGAAAYRRAESSARRGRRSYCRIS